jgi:hypothetical protein
MRRDFLFPFFFFCLKRLLVLVLLWDFFPFLMVFRLADFQS